MKLSKSETLSAIRYNNTRGYSQSAWLRIQELCGAKCDAWVERKTAQAIADLQRRLGIKADGKFGPATIKAVDDADLRLRLLVDREDRHSLSDIIKAYPERPIVIDVSMHQDEIDWSKVADAGVAGAIIKSSEGRGYVDPKHAQNWKGAKDAGIPRAAYQYMHLAWKGKQTDPKVQVDNMARLIADDPAELRCALDYEYKELDELVKLKGLQATLDWMLEAHVYFKSVFGYEPLVYWSARSIRMMGKPEVFRYCKHWIAGYPRTPFPLSERTEPFRYLDGWPWDIWQFSCKGIVGGIEGDCDLNLMNGSLTRLEV